MEPVTVSILFFTDEDKLVIEPVTLSILFFIELLNVEYPVVLVMSICDEPDTNDVSLETIEPVIYTEPVN